VESFLVGDERCYNIIRQLEFPGELLKIKEEIMAKFTEDDLRETLDDAAVEIAQLTPNPRSWQTWMVYLLERLESQAVKSPAYTETFAEMLVTLQDELRNRLKTGGW
jgi:hypothetical protein